MSEDMGPPAAPDSAVPSGEGSEPPARRPRWWSPRRAALPVVLILLVAAGAWLVRTRVTEERRGLEAEIADMQSATEDLDRRIDIYREQLPDLERDVAQQRELAAGCAETAKIGVRFLHGVVKQLTLIQRFENEAAEEERGEINRLIDEANEGSRRCAQGVI